MLKWYLNGWGKLKSLFKTITSLETIKRRLAENILE